MILAHRVELIEILPLSDLYTIYQDHHRLTVFVNKGRKCVTCDRVGTLLLITQELDSKHHRERDSIGRLHVDLYTDDFVLMTVDHITPKKVAKTLGWPKEWTEALSNKQPMCDPCNNKKGCRTLTNEQLAYMIQSRRTSNTKNARPKLAGVEIIRSLVPNIHRLNNDYTIL